MTWTDLNLGHCACGSYRRLFQPEGHDLRMCSVCARQWFMGGMTPKPKPKFAENYKRVKERRARLVANGLCVECARRPPLRKQNGTPALRCFPCSRRKYAAQCFRRAHSEAA